MTLSALILGAGDIATGVAIRLHQAGAHVVMTEIAQPMVVRRSVAFANAIYEDGAFSVENVKCRVVQNVGMIDNCHSQNEIALLVDDEAKVAGEIVFDILVDARMIKIYSKVPLTSSPYRIGIGPGFTVGENCLAIIESKRGPTMGRVIWSGSAEPDTGIPEKVENVQAERVLRSPGEGFFLPQVDIGDVVQAGQTIASVDGKQIVAPFGGLIRGMLHKGLKVKPGTKVGDIDPRPDPRLCQFVSDKSMAVGSGVIEIILKIGELKRKLLSE